MELKEPVFKSMQLLEDNETLKSITKTNGLEVYTFKGYLSTFNNVDLHGDVIEKGAFKKSIEKNPKVKLLLDHKQTVKNTLGTVHLLEEDDEGLKIEAEVLKTASIENDLIPKIKAGLINSLSIGMWLKKFKYNEETNGFLIKEAEVIEGSIVSIPANPKAMFSDFKGFKNFNTEDIQEIFKGITNIRDYEEYLIKYLSFTSKGAKTFISKSKQLFRDEKTVQANDMDIDVKTLQELTNLMKGIL